MNAGAYGGELKDVLKEVTVMTREGEILTIPAEKMEMGYRTSIIKTAGYLVLEAVISLKKGDEEAIRATMKDLSNGVQKSSLLIIQAQAVPLNGLRDILRES